MYKRDKAVELFKKTVEEATGDGVGTITKEAVWEILRKAGLDPRASEYTGGDNPKWDVPKAMRMRGQIVKLASARRLGNGYVLSNDPRAPKRKSYKKRQEQSPKKKKEEKGIEHDHPKDVTITFERGSKAIYQNPKKVIIVMSIVLLLFFIIPKL